MSDAETVTVKKFSFRTYDVYLEVNKKTKDKKTKYWYHLYAQNHPVRNKSVQPYNQAVSTDYDTVWEAIFNGYTKVEIFERKNNK